MGSVLRGSTVFPGGHHLVLGAHDGRHRGASEGHGEDAAAPYPISGCIGRRLHVGGVLGTGLRGKGRRGRGSVKAYGQRPRNEPPQGTAMVSDSLSLGCFTTRCNEAL